MDTSISVLIIACFFHIACASHVSGISSFGDSFLDAGNNNYVPSAAPTARSDQTPYGRLFQSGPTGRFTDGKLVSDIIANKLGLPFPLPFLNSDATRDKLLYGSNFASGGAGLLNTTTNLQGVVTLDTQISWFSNYKKNLSKLVGVSCSDKLIKNGLYFFSAGVNDFAFKQANVDEINTSPQDFRQKLLNNFMRYIKEIYEIGARDFVIFSLPPFGCSPGLITFFNPVTRQCVDVFNNQAKDFNAALQTTVSSLEQQLVGSKLLYFDSYTISLDFVQNPSKYGFTVTNRGCCGTGLSEIGQACNQFVGACPDASKYVYFDAAHGSLATYQRVADQLSLKLKDKFNV